MLQPINITKGYKGIPSQAPLTFEDPCTSPVLTCRGFVFRGEASNKSNMSDTVSQVKAKEVNLTRVHCKYPSALSCRGIFCSTRERREKTRHIVLSTAKRQGSQHCFHIQLWILYPVSFWRLHVSGKGSPKWLHPVLTVASAPSCICHGYLPLAYVLRLSVPINLIMYRTCSSSIHSSPSSSPSNLCCSM